MSLISLHIDRLLLAILMSFRLGAFFLAMPVVSDLRVPVVVRVILPLTIAALLAPLLPTLPPPLMGTDVLRFLIAILNETLVGLVMGFSVHLLFMLANVAGEIAGLESGFSIASVFDPNLGHASLLAFFMRLFLVLAFFLTDMHHVFLRAVVASYESLPPGGGGFPAQDVLAGFMKLFNAVYFMAFRFALPVLLAVFLAHLLVGIVSVTAPQMNFYFNVALSFNVVFGMAIVALGFGMLMAFYNSGTVMVNEFLREVFAAR